MIDRVLPLAAAVSTRMPRGLQTTYGDLSNRILRSSTAYRVLRDTVAEMGSQLCDLSRAPAGAADQRLLEFTAALVPHDVDSLEITRLGDATDGGYATALPLAPGTVVLSIGVGHDVSWDVAMAARGARIELFDPTVDDLPSAVPHSRFHRIGLGARQSDIGGFPTTDLDGLLDLANVADEDPRVLKVDIEGGEWAALRDTDFDCFDQVLIEMHDIDRVADADRAADVLAVARSLARTHVAVHVHGNNERPFVRFDDYWFCEVVEATFVHRRLAGDARPSRSLQRHLDLPSNPAFKDYDLNGLTHHPRAIGG